MASSCIGWTPLLLCLVQLLHFHTHTPSASGVHPHGHANFHHSVPWLCRPDQANALLKLKQSFYFHRNGRFPYDLESTTTLPSWKPGTDCCLWEGVGCSNSSSGHHVVTALDLSGFRLNSDGIHPALFNLTSLRMLDLSMNKFRGYDLSPIGFERLSSLTHLNLSTSGISGQVPIGISKLTNLVSLDLSYGDIDTGDSVDIFDAASNGLRVPSFDTLVANLRNLIEFYLDSVGISSSVQDCFIALAKSVPNLRALSLQGCGLQGHIDSSLSRLKSLTVINLSGNYAITPGPFPKFLMNFPNLRVLQLSGINLQGWFPRGMFLSKNIRLLDLSGNPNLSGHLPSFSNAAFLETLWIDSTNFSYVINSSYLSDLNALTELGIDGNMISMDFLSSFGMIASLRQLFVAQLDSPRQLESLFTWSQGIKNLRSLTFIGCDLSMTIPSSIGNMTNLERLNILNCWSSRPTGPIPHEVGALKKLKSLVLPSMGLSGRIPSTIANLTKLIELDLNRNYLSGEISASLFILPKLVYLDLSYNQLSGLFLDYSNNSFSSLLPNFTIYLRSTQYLWLSNNNISGYLPSSICHSPLLKVLDLSYNNFSGPLPRCLMEKAFLTIINLRENQLNGKLPSNISIGCAAQTIDLNGNKIEGKLPRALSNCSNLEFLDLGRNQIADTFPKWLGGLLNLRVLILRSNKFHGSIGHLEDEKYRGHFSSLQIIDLASNNFSGKLHPQWFENLKSMRQQGNSGKIIDHPNIGVLYQDSITISYKGFAMTFEKILTTLTAIDISNNALEGSIPTSIGDLFALHVLNMSHNAFTGKLPPQLGSITALESLDLSSNKLSGEIPQELTDLTFLSTLNLSNNQLDGRIPQSRQFATFQESSFDGNAGLCGPPLCKKCGPSDTPRETQLKRSAHGVDVVLFLFAGVGFGVGFEAAIVLKLDYWISRWFHIFRILC